MKFIIFILMSSLCLFSSPLSFAKDKVSSASKTKRNEKKASSKKSMKKKVKSAIAFSHSAKIIPHFDAEGNVAGIRFLDIKKGSKWEAWGIKVGETVTSINNKKVTNPKDMEKTYNQNGPHSKVRFGKLSPQ